MFSPVSHVSTCFPMFSAVFTCFPMFSADFTGYHHHRLDIVCACWQKLFVSSGEFEFEQRRRQIFLSPSASCCTPPQSPPLKHSRAAWAGLKTVGRRTPIRKLSTSSCRSRAREARLRQARKSGAERPVLDRPRRFPLNHHSRVFAITWRDAKLCFKLDAKLYSRKLGAKFDIKLTLQRDIVLHC